MFFVPRADLSSGCFPPFSSGANLKHSTATTRSSKQAHSGDGITLQNMDQINANTKDYSLTDASCDLQQQPSSNRLES